METTTIRTCRQCREYRKCAKGLKRLGCDPDDPNNEAIKICVRWRPRTETPVMGVPPVHVCEKCGTKFNRLIHCL